MGGVQIGRKVRRGVGRGVGRGGGGGGRESMCSPFLAVIVFISRRESLVKEGVVDVLERGSNAVLKMTQGDAGRRGVRVEAVET